MHGQGRSLFDVLHIMRRGIRWGDREMCAGTVRRTLSAGMRITSGTPWGMHYASHHHGQAPPAGKPFGEATILMKESSPVNRRIMEAIFIRERGPSVNNDRGWLLVDNV